MLYSKISQLRVSRCGSLGDTTNTSLPVSRDLFFNHFTILYLKNIEKYCDIPQHFLHCEDFTFKKRSYL